MPLVKAQCENCNGVLTVDSSKRAAICPYCGTPYVVQDAINYHTTQVENLHADVVNIYNQDSKLELLKRADTFYELGQFEDAVEAYNKATKLYPDEHRGWWGVYKTIISKRASFSIEEEYKRYAAVAMKLHDYSAEYHQLWESVCEQYCEELSITADHEQVWTLLSWRDRDLMLHSNVDAFDNPCLKKMQTALLEYYYSAFKNGAATFFTLSDKFETQRFWRNEVIHYPPKHRTRGEPRKLEAFPVLQMMLNEGFLNSQKLSHHDKFKEIVYLKSYLRYASSYDYHWSNCIMDYTGQSVEQDMSVNAKHFAWEKLYKIVFILGKTVIVEFQKYDDGSFVSAYQILLMNECLSPDQITKLEVEYWKQNNRCAHCGGTLSKRLFSIICDNCKVKKDY